MIVMVMVPFCKLILESEDFAEGDEYEGDAVAENDGDEDEAADDF